ncbi:MAG: hypothetical protein GY708_16995, partial [Actinomycetia bacterium]|nr:hypothetical protein [Actinomycetes bacterium]
MKQRRLLALVVAFAVLSVAAGWFAGRSLKSSDEALEDAASAFYTDSGYRAPGPSLEEQEQLTQAQEAVTQARNQVRSIQQSLNEASRPIAEST